jgi:hypothetical protein
MFLFQPELGKVSQKFAADKKACDAAQILSSEYLDPAARRKRKGDKNDLLTPHEHSPDINTESANVYQRTESCDKQNDIGLSSASAATERGCIPPRRSSGADGLKDV